MTGKYVIRIKPTAAKQLAELDRQAQRRIQAVLALLSDNPRPPKAAMLTNTDGLMKIRTGDYRIVYQLNDSELLVLVVKVGHRGSVYRSL